MLKSLFNKLTNDVAKRITELARQINDDVKRLIHPDKSPDVHTIQDVLRGFDNPFLSLMSESMTDVSVEPFTPEQMRHYKVGDVELSDRLYRQAQETAARVRKIVVDRAQYGHDAQKLALDLYEGYGFRDNEALVPKVRLPKYMNDALLNRDMDALMARIQAAKLKTAPLRAAYLQALDRVIKGKGTAAIDKALDVAVQERYRYFANRIARTELARLQNAQIARDMMADDAVQVVQLRLSAKHPKSDVCDMYSKQDAYGLGAGCYPKSKAPLPPFHPHCLPGDALITACGRVTAVSKRWFDGDVAVITTASGKCLAATVNHPVLTGRGWVGAGFIDIGDKVVARFDGVAATCDGVPDHQHQDMPASIAEIADAFFSACEVTTRKVEIATEDFHGDGIAGQVAVIGTYRKLWDRVDTGFSEVRDNHLFKITCTTLAGLFSNRVFNFLLKALWLPSYGIVGSSSECGSLLAGHPRHTPKLGIRSTSNRHPTAFDNRIDRSSADTDFFCQSENGSPQLVLGDNVLFDCVVAVKRRNFNGHVYNLETEHGHYTANGIVTHNCNCFLRERPDLSVKHAKHKPESAVNLLSGLSTQEAARIVGSQEKLLRLLSGEPFDAIINAGRPNGYQIKSVGDA